MNPPCPYCRGHAVEIDRQPVIGVAYLFCGRCRLVAPDAPDLEGARENWRRLADLCNPHR